MRAVSMTSGQKPSQLPAGFYKPERAPRFQVKREFATSFLTSFRGMPYTGGGKCRLQKGQVFRCSRWIHGRTPKGFFSPEDRESFDWQWVPKDEYAHPDYLGPAILIKAEDLDMYCERMGKACQPCVKSYL